jgi:hypothetical protein
MSGPQRASRHEMLVELASDAVSDAAEHALSDYRSFHAWLQPMFLAELSARFASEDDQAVADHYASQLGSAPPGWEEEDDGDAPAETAEPSGRYVARFHPQAWIRGHAVDVDREGPVRWDCTEYVEALDEPSRTETLTPNTYASDLLRSVSTAPRWVQLWRGPYWIEVEDREAVATAEPLAATG